jgi:hypothetical protein
MTYQEWMREERRCGRKPSREATWNAALRLGGAPAEQSGEAPRQQLKAAIALVLKQNAITNEGYAAKQILEDQLVMLERRAAV